MTQKTSPFLEAKYGWDYGESGWNIGADENWLKFSYLFDGNIDGIVDNLPLPAVPATAYYLNTDKRIYFAVDGTYYSTPLPKWFQFKLRSNGTTYLFNGTTVNQILSPANVQTQLDSKEPLIASGTTLQYLRGDKTFQTLNKAAVGLANVDNTSDVNKPISTAQQLGLDLKASLSGANFTGQVSVLSQLVTYSGNRAVNASFVKDLLTPSVKWYGAVGDGVTDDTAAFQAAYAANQKVAIPRGNYLVTQQVGSLTDGKGIVWLGDGGADSVVKFKGLGGFLVSGKSWEIAGIRFMPSGVVPFVFKTGTTDDNHGGSFHNNIVETDTNADYFSIVGDFYSAWYCRIHDNFIRNGLFNTGFNGIGFRFNYSVNNILSGNTIGATSIAVDVTSLVGPNGNVCEGITVADNIILANDIHFRAMAGLLFQLDNNVFDLTSPAGIPILIDGGFCLVMRGNWIASFNPSIVRNSDRHIIDSNIFSALSTTLQQFSIENSKYGQFTNNNMLSGGTAFGVNANCTGWIIDTNQFTGQTTRACNLTLLTDSQFSNNRENNNPNPSLLSATIYSNPDEYVDSIVTSVTAGVASFTFSIPMPTGRFKSTPRLAEISVQSGTEPLLWTYNNSASSATTAQFTVYPRTGNLVGGNIRFGVFVRK